MENVDNINQIEKQIKVLEKQKTTLQSKCKHTDTRVKFENNTNNMRVYCCDCNVRLGFPNKEEISNFLK
jgi:hypothetical protein